jgi:hypothetical protein
MSAAREELEELERSYQRYTRLFPPAYRAAREDEMLAVLLDTAAPGQSRATLPEALDLIGSATRQWLPHVVGPDRASRRSAAAMLAVLLPAVFLYGAGLSVRAVAALPATAVPGYLRADRYWLVWLAWAVVNLLLLLRAPRWARGVAILTTVLYVALMSYSLWQRGPNPFAPAVAWLLVQILAATLLLRSFRVRRGFELVTRWWQLGVGSVAFALGLSHFWWSSNRGSSADWLLILVTLVAGVVAMRSPAGRVIVPVLGGVAAFAVVTRVWATNIRRYDHSGLNWVQLPDIFLLVVVPLVTLVLLRLVASTLSRMWTRGSGSAGRAVPPDLP